MLNAQDHQAPQEAHPAHQELQVDHPEHQAAQLSPKHLKEVVENPKAEVEANQVIMIMMTITTDEDADSDEQGQIL